MNQECQHCKKPLTLKSVDGLCPECLLKVGLGTVGPGGTSAFEVPSLEELREQFPQFEIIELLGRGGMGAVYKARQKKLDRFVALKILPPDIGNDPAFAERFEREARALAKLNHPNIVTLYEFGESNGLYYFLMEFVDGVNLRQLMHSGRVAPREALAIVPQICDALQYAHDQGIVHRDIKPENILLDRQGRVKVADFGLAKIVARDVARHSNVEPLEPQDSTLESRVTEESRATIMGTPQYMAPEQREHPSEVDHRADIYSLGVVFYQMLTGEMPQSDLVPPSKKVVVDVRLDEVVLRALEKRPELRYQQVNDVKTIVETIISSSANATPGAPVAAAKKSDMVRIVEVLGRITFTSPLAIRLVNFSALGFLGFLAYLGYFDPRLKACFGFFGLFGLFGLIGLAGMVERAARRKSKVPLQTPNDGRADGAIKRKLKSLFFVTLPVAVLAVVTVRAFFMQAFVAVTDAVAPEVPCGSRVLVWKPAHHFAPGDIIAYRDRDHVNLARVKKADARSLVVSRNHEPDATVSRDAIVGKVFGLYWRSLLGGRADAEPPRAPLAMNGPPFSANYPNGTVKLAGLASNSGVGGPCWQADGAPMKEPLECFQPKNHRKAKDDVSAADRAIAIRVRSKSSTTATARLEFPDFPDATKNGACAFYRDVLEPLQLTLCQDFACPPGVAFARVRVGVIDDWIPVAEWNAESGITLTMDQEENVVAQVQEEFFQSGVETMVQASDRAGAYFLGQPQAGSTSGTRLFSFPRLKRSGLHTLRVCQGHLAWVEFRNVSLQSGYQTAVEVVEAARAPEIERVVVSKDQAVITGRSPDAGLFIIIGTHTNAWSHSGSPFTVTRRGRWFGRGYEWFVKLNAGLVWKLESDNGPVTGSIVFRPGMPVPEGDGSYVVGEFKSETGEALPLIVRLEKLSKQTASPAFPVASQEHSFGPVIEQEFSSDLLMWTNCWALNLASGNVLRFDLQRPPPDATNSLAIAATGQPDDMLSLDRRMPSFRAAHVDLMQHMDASISDMLWAFDMHLIRLSTNDWNLSAAEVAARLAPVAATIHDPSMEIITGECAYLFATRDGARGILQIMRETTHLRYKLIHGGAVANLKPGFGPVLERELVAAPHRGKQDALDLDEDRALPVPKKLIQQNNPRPLLDWMVANRLDLIINNTLTDDFLGLHLDDGFFIRTPPQFAFDSIDVGEVSRHQAKPGPLQYVMLPKREIEDQPVFLFQTREGGRGVLLITGFTPDAGTVKLRYKLVQEGATKAAAGK